MWPSKKVLVCLYDDSRHNVKKYRKWIIESESQMEDYRKWMYGQTICISSKLILKYYTNVRCQVKYVLSSKLFKFTGKSYKENIIKKDVAK